MHGTLGMDWIPTKVLRLWRSRALSPRQPPSGARLRFVAEKTSVRGSFALLRWDELSYHIPPPWPGPRTMVWRRGNQNFIKHSTPKIPAEGLWDANFLLPKTSVVAFFEPQRWKGHFSISIIALSARNHTTCFSTSNLPIGPCRWDDNKVPSIFWRTSYYLLYLRQGCLSASAVKSNIRMPLCPQYIQGTRNVSDVESADGASSLRRLAHVLRKETFTFVHQFIVHILLPCLGTPYYDATHSLNGIYILLSPEWYYSQKNDTIEAVNGGHPTGDCR